MGNKYLKGTLEFQKCKHFKVLYKYEQIYTHSFQVTDGLQAPNILRTSVWSVGTWNAKTHHFFAPELKILENTLKKLMAK